MIETRQEKLKELSTPALKSLMDYAISQREYFRHEGTKSSWEMVQKYKMIIGKLEDELATRLEDVFVF